MVILINKIRIEKDISLRGLSIKTGISKTRLNDMERNIISPKLDDLEKIAKALNVKISDLFYSDFN